MTPCRRKIPLSLEEQTRFLWRRPAVFGRPTIPACWSNIADWGGDEIDCRRQVVPCVERLLDIQPQDIRKNLEVPPMVTICDDDMLAGDVANEVPQVVQP